MSVYPKHYIDKDVLTAARERMDQVLDQFDDAYVAFSGGKDSLVCVHLFKEAWDRAGRTGPIKVSFLDEELIPDSVIDFVDEYRRKDWIRLFWYAFPLESNKFVLGKIDSYIQWDPDRPHVRDVPPWAITPEPGRKGPFSQYTMMREIARQCRGRVANITGIRCDESLNRYGSVAQKQHNCWFSQTDHPSIVHCKPIYDWTENDVFKYLGENNIRYCRHYDAQLYSRTPFRVSTPVHSGSAKRFRAWRELDPDFHQRVTAVFPEMHLQERYYGELSRDRENSIEAMEDWVRENVADGQMPKAVEFLTQIKYELKTNVFEDDTWNRIWSKFMSGSWLKANKDLGLRSKSRRKEK